VFLITVQGFLICVTTPAVEISVDIVRQQ
jgi:hypothetical protein